MDAEWARTVEGKLAIDRLVAALIAAAAPAGITRHRWGFRRASLVEGEMTYRYGPDDDREAVADAYGRDIDSAQLVLALWPGEAGDPEVVVHLVFDGGRTRIRAESGTVHLLERIRNQLG